MSQASKLSDESSVCECVRGLGYQHSSRLDAYQIDVRLARQHSKQDAQGSDAGKIFLLKKYVNSWV